MNEKADINFEYGLSDAAILQKLGGYLKQMRLNEDMTQGTLATRAGVARSVVSSIENGKGGTLTSLVQILRVLRKLDTLNVFVVEEPISPMYIAKMAGKRRQRASKASKPKPYNTPSEW
ncbi:MAG: XRE family transcriptional regulator [Sphingobacteriia bacterium]|jgi:transcriptional regulator with XRE-family HTH domain|nr:XRE family transcriptional regulator [Sphingobacteriia bacterium]